jgi:Ca2+-binding RTX toxin-like protein
MATYVGTIGNDFVVSGYDYVYGLDGSDFLGASAGGYDVVEGGRGNDFIYFTGAGTDYGSLYGGDGTDFVMGHLLGDYLYGGEGNDVLVGGWITTYSGTNLTPVSYDSENGNDYLDGGNGNDALYGFGGNDRLFGGDGDEAGTVSVPSNTYYNDNIIANYKAGLYGGSGNDYLDGGAGNDRLEGGIGGDSLFGGIGNDLVYGDNADGSGVGGVDWIEGGDGNDQLAGQGGNDVIFGGVGNDSIYGGTGFDVLYGGIGADNFYLDGPLDGYDYVGDFKPSDYDALVLTSANFGGITNATIASHFYSGPGFAGFAVAGPYFAYDTNSGNLWYNTPGDPTLIAQLTVANLSSSSMYFA